MPTAAFTTLGCKVNQYETQKILDSFESAGFSTVAFDQPADVYVINTCSVTSEAERKSRYTVRRAIRTNPEAKIVVTGCAVQMSINREEDFPDVHVAVSNPDKLETLDHFLRAYPELKPSGEPTTNADLQGRTRATLKVQDGCDVMCSYCSIPYTRPGMRSRPWQEVLEEAQSLAERGYKEAILTGVLIGAYGPESGSGGIGFEKLVQKLDEESGLERLRISSIEMHQVTEPIIDLAKSGHVAPHFHIPLQSGDTGVLKDMNRRYNQDDYLRLCDRVYESIPDVMITTDILVGFPTEDEERFQSSVKVCEHVQYLKAHVFRFSPRFGTPADQWGDPVDPQTKAARSKRLVEVTTASAQNQMKRFLGRTMRVLVERRSKKDGLLQGTTDNWLSVKFAGPPEFARTMQWVRLDELQGGTLIGELASEPARPQLQVV